MKYLIANWKMYGEASQVRTWISDVSKVNAQANASLHVVLCPSNVFLSEAKRYAAKLPYVSLGAQDCHFEKHGAYTGDISAAMLKNAGADYIILGHSERRSLHFETSEIIANKCRAAVKASTIPIVCVGESKSERDAGHALQCVQKQLTESLTGVKGELIIAYEPVWAIGSGQTPMLEEITAMHQFIKTLCVEMQLTRDSATCVVYGGSVNATNAASIMALPEVDGALIGSASISSESFCAIIEATRSVTPSDAKYMASRA